MNNPPEIVVIHEGGDWFAVNKPAGLSVHNDAGNDLVSAFAGRGAVFLLNRLDQDVSGIVLLATNAATASAIQQQFADRTVEKEYRAIGRMAAGSEPPTESGGTWKQALTKKAENRKKPAGFGGRRVPCQTDWRVERVDGEMVHLILTPHTGRKHQLRRHAAIAGWPLLGDRRYGADDASNDFGGRIALHAESLTLTDPLSGERVALTCPAQWG